MKPSAIRQAIRAGGRDIIFTEDPGLDVGEKIVLLRTKAKGDVRWVIVQKVTPPAEPSWWVRNPPPPVWTVRVSRHELERPRMLRAGPLPHTEPDTLQRDQVKAPTPDEIERAAVESSYRSSGDPLNAGEAVGDEWLQRFAGEAKAKRSRRLREAIERR